MAPASEPGSVAPSDAAPSTDEPPSGDAPRAMTGAIPAGLVEALGRIPELAGRGMSLTPLTGGITNRNFRIDLTDSPRRDSASAAYVVRLAGNDTHLLGISREVEHAATVAAAGVGVGPEVVAFLRPEGYLVTRFIEGQPIDDAAVHRPATLRQIGQTIRRIHDGPPIPGIFVPYRIGEAYQALAEARGVTIPAAYGPAHEAVRRIELACLQRPVPMRPCHNDLLNANFIDDGSRIRIVDWEYAGMGDPFFDLGNVAVNHELSGDEEGLVLAAYDGLPDGALDPDRLARLRLMRVVSDFREAMWGVLQQALSSLEVDFVAYADEHFGRLLGAAQAPRFADDLRLVAGPG
jgi:thiamine kinase-like enzyme